MKTMKTRLVHCTFTFEAAHRLTKVDPGHKCARLHGHSFTAIVYVNSVGLDKADMVVDFDEVREAFRPLHAELDHNYLNEVSGLENPTSENIAQWIYERMVLRFDEMKISEDGAVSVSHVEVSETCRSGAVYPSRM